MSVLGGIEYLARLTWEGVIGPAMKAMCVTRVTVPSREQAASRAPLPPWDADSEESDKEGAPQLRSITAASNEDWRMRRAFLDALLHTARGGGQHTVKEGC